MCLVGAEPEQTQHVFGHRIRGMGVVAFAVFPQECAETQQRATGHGKCKFRIVDREPPGVDGGPDVP